MGFRRPCACGLSKTQHSAPPARNFCLIPSMPRLKHKNFPGKLQRREAGAHPARRVCAPASAPPSRPAPHPAHHQTAGARCAHLIPHVCIIVYEDMVQICEMFLKEELPCACGAYEEACHQTRCAARTGAHRVLTAQHDIEHDPAAPNCRGRTVHFKNSFLTHDHCAVTGFALPIRLSKTDTATN